MEILESHVPLAACAPATLFLVGRINKNGTTSKWEAIDKYAPVIGATLEANSGKTVRQKRFHEQLRAFLEKHDMRWHSDDTERAAYHFRVMLRTLQGLRRSGRKPPTQYGHLQVLVDKCVLDRPAPSDACDACVDNHDADDHSHDDDTDTSHECVEVPLLKRPIEQVDVQSSQENDLESGAASGDDLEAALFGSGARKHLATTPPHKPKIAAALATQTPSKSLPALPGPINYNDIAKLTASLCAGAAVGPTPREYMALSSELKKKATTSRQAVMKKPAAAEAAAAASPSFPLEDAISKYLKVAAPEKVVRKRLHSNIWHKERDFQASLGVDDNEAKRKASMAAATAIDRFMQLRAA